MLRRTGDAVVQGLIRLLSTCASGSAGAAESLLLLRISSILKDVLAGSGLVSSTSGSGLSVNRPPEQACVGGGFGLCDLRRRLHWMSVGGVACMY